MRELRRTHFFQMADWCDIDDIGREYYVYQENSSEKGMVMSKDQLSSMKISEKDEMIIDTVSMPIHPSKENVKSNAGGDCKRKKTPKKKKAFPMSFASLELLRNYMSGYKRLRGENLNKSSEEALQPTKGGRELSTDNVMRIAAARYIQFSLETEDDLSTLKLPFGSMLSGLSDEETEDVELTHLLLTSAEKIGNWQYDQARNSLLRCSRLGSNVGNPVQRVVHYFTDALRERIDRETGRVSLKGSDGTRWGEGEDVEEMRMGPDLALLACHQLVPIPLVTQFVEIQAIIENMVSVKRIHLIDLGIKVGIQWSILMQALKVRSTCPVEHLKISAVGTLKEKMNQTGRQLASFAESLKLPFTFKMVIVSDMNDLHEDLFEIEADEVVGVYASLILRNMIIKPNCLENLLRVIRRLKPRIMTVTEVEAGEHNSSSFINRFIESLFFYSAWFDCLNDCMDRDDPNRMSLEGKFLSRGIRSIVATEGDERMIRHVGINLWRSFFGWFGFVETEPSHASLFQARLVAKKFACGGSVNLDMNEKSLTVGWKGTPLFSFSAWKLR